MLGLSALGCMLCTCIRMVTVSWMPCPYGVAALTREHGVGVAYCPVSCTLNLGPYLFAR